MRRSIVLLSILALVAAVGLGADRLAAITAQDATPTVIEPALIGSWRVVVDDVTGPPHPALITFAADGTMTASEPPILPAPPGAPFTQFLVSSGNGVWATLDGNAAMTFDLMATDETGALLGIFTVRGTLAVTADGQRFEGVYDVVLTDPAGVVVPAGSGIFTGTRITLEPMGTPAATPSL